jgi:hypothetical protein
MMPLLDQGLSIVAKPASASTEERAITEAVSESSCRWRSLHHRALQLRMSWSSRASLSCDALNLGLELDDPGGVESRIRGWGCLTPGRLRSASALKIGADRKTRTKG